MKVSLTQGSPLADAIRDNLITKIRDELFRALANPDLDDSNTVTALIPACRHLLRSQSVSEVTSELLPAVSMLVQHESPRSALSAAFPKPLEWLARNIPSEASSSEDLRLAVLLINLCDSVTKGFTSVRLQSAVLELFTDATSADFVKLLHAGLPSHLLPDLDWILDSYFHHTDSENAFAPATRIFRALRHEGVELDVLSVQWKSAVLLRAFFEAVPSASVSALRDSIYQSSESATIAYSTCVSLGIQRTTTFASAKQHLDFLKSSQASLLELVDRLSLGALQPAECSRILQAAYLKLSFSKNNTKTAQSQLRLLEDATGLDDSFVYSLMLADEYAVNHLQRVETFTDSQLNQIALTFTFKTQPIFSDLTHGPSVSFGLFLRDTGFLARLQSAGLQYSAEPDFYRFIKSLLPIADLLRPFFPDPRQFPLHTVNGRSLFGRDADQARIRVSDELALDLVRRRVPFAELQSFCHPRSPIMQRTSPMSESMNFQDILLLQAASATPEQIFQIVSSPALLAACRMAIPSSSQAVDNLLGAASVSSPKLL